MQAKDSGGTVLVCKEVRGANESKSAHRQKAALRLCGEAKPPTPLRHLPNDLSLFITTTTLKLKIGLKYNDTDMAPSECLSQRQSPFFQMAAIRATAIYLQGGLGPTGLAHRTNL